MARTGWDGGRKLGGGIKRGPGSGGDAGRLGSSRAEDPCSGQSSTELYLACISKQTARFDRHQHHERHRHRIKMHV